MAHGHMQHGPRRTVGLDYGHGVTVHLVEATGLFFTLLVNGTFLRFCLVLESARR